jgi:hypothetical protein
VTKKMPDMEIGRRSARSRRLRSSTAAHRAPRLANTAREGEMEGRQTAEDVGEHVGW